MVIILPTFGTIHNNAIGVIVVGRALLGLLVRMLFHHFLSNLVVAGLWSYLFSVANRQQKSRWRGCSTRIKYCGAL